MSADNMIAVIEFPEGEYVVQEITYGQLEQLNIKKINSFNRISSFEIAMKHAVSLYKEKNPEYGIRIIDLEHFI